MTLLVKLEGAFRTHRVAVAVGTCVVMAIVSVAELWTTSDFALALTLDVAYAVPLALCAYGLGLRIGMAAAVGVSVIELIDTINEGIPQPDITLICVVRFISYMGMTAVAAAAAAAVRARERYLEAERQTVRLRADLVAAFSHDLRSPLMAIATYARLLQRRADYPALETFGALDRILDQARRLENLIADMLRAGNADNAAPLQVSGFNADALITELKTEFEHLVHRAEVTLVWYADPLAPPLQTDRTKLASVVRNLVNNAVKFTGRGTVNVRIDYRESAHRIRIEDTGPGIAPDALPHIFDRYYQVAGTQQGHGFGFGLFIVKRFCDLLGASLDVESQLGRGATFIVTVPRLDEDAASDVPRHRWRTGEPVSPP